MGAVLKFTRKITGVQDQIDATNANAQAQEDSTRQAAQDQQNALNSQAEAAAQSQAQAAARSAAESKAEEIISAPLQTADVQLDPDQLNSVTATRKARQASFGRNYSGGVSI